MAPRLTASTAKKKTAVAGGRSRLAEPPTGPQPPYGDPIRQAIEQGTVADMRRVGKDARTWLKDADKRTAEVRRALAKLDKAIKDLGR